MESEIGVDRNWSWDSAARLVYVRQKLLARLWILGTSTCSGRRKSSRGSLVVAIEGGETWGWGDNDKIKEESSRSGTRQRIHILSLVDVGCNVVQLCRWV
jgi:hypothetical protein